MELSAKGELLRIYISAGRGSRALKRFWRVRAGCMGRTPEKIAMCRKRGVRWSPAYAKGKVQVDEGASFKQRMRGLRVHVITQRVSVWDVLKSRREGVILRVDGREKGAEAIMSYARSTITSLYVNCSKSPVRIMTILWGIKPLNQITDRKKLRTILLIPRTVQLMAGELQILCTWTWYSPIETLEQIGETAKVWVRMPTRFKCQKRGHGILNCKAAQAAQWYHRWGSEEHLLNACTAGQYYCRTWS